MKKGRIIKGVGGLYSIDTSEEIYLCRPRGIFRKHKISPVIGDYVEISILDEVEKTGTIEKILERKNDLIRPKVSNVDQAIIVFAAINPKPNLDLLDRFIILSEAENINVIICLNKTDLAPSADVMSFKEIYDKVGYVTILTSAINNDGIDKIKNSMNDKVTIFAGPSGVGKSSLINSIVPGINMETGEISAKNLRGKHTTRHSELITAWSNSYIVDTPGFSSISMNHIEPDELDSLFIDFRPYLGNCKFNNCTHINEPECSIKQNVEMGNILKLRYRRYINIFEELK